MGVGVAVALLAVVAAVTVAVGVDTVPLGAEAPSGLFAEGFGFIVLGFGLLAALGASALPRLGGRVRGGAARLGVGAGCVASGAVGLWALGAGALIPVVLQPGAFGTLWALGFATAGAVLLGASATGLCRAVRRPAARRQTHYSG